MMVMGQMVGRDCQAVQPPKDMCDARGVDAAREPIGGWSAGADRVVAGDWRD